MHMARPGCQVNEKASCKFLLFFLDNVVYWEDLCWEVSPKFAEACEKLEVGKE